MTHFEGKKQANTQAALDKGQVYTTKL